MKKQILAIFLCLIPVSYTHRDVYKRQEYGPVHFQLQVDDLDAFYERVKDICALEITMKPFVRPYGWKMFRMKDPAGNHIDVYKRQTQCSMWCVRQLLRCTHTSFFKLRFQPLSKRLCP